MAESHRMILSKEGEERLRKIMVELELVDQRPVALRIAFARGLAGLPGIPAKKERVRGKFEVPPGVIGRGDEYLLFKHLIIQKAGRPLTEEEIDEYMHGFLEEGLEIMEDEIDNKLSDLDNYLLYLVAQAQA